MAGRPAKPTTAVAPLAQALRRHREDAGMTRVEVAARAKISTNTLTALEQGRTHDPGFFKVAALCEALNIRLDELREEVGGQASATKQPMSNGIVSVGYEGRNIDSFVGAIMDAGVTTVVDVRMTPLSRKPGFSKTKLSRALTSAGVAYEHVRSLGNPRENREPFWTGRAAEGQAVFRDLLDDDGRAAINRLTELARSDVIAVLCFEYDQATCHRQVVIDEMTKQRSMPVLALH